MFDLCAGTLIAYASTLPIPMSGSESTIPTIDNKYSEYPTYSGTDLGLTISDRQIPRFRVWAPSAEKVLLKIYDVQLGDTPIDEIEMSESEGGTWFATLPSSTIGKYYTFSIFTDGKWLDETPGIWAKAVGVNGQRGAIINISDTNPYGWNEDRGPELKAITDAIIYEMHHRDFSIHPSSGIVNKGKFLALTEAGTITPDGESTGIDHLKDLGVTHIHILPSYDFNTLDETELPSSGYNWGYDPQNYNVPEGTYSTDPYNPSVRITEMKKMIKSLHEEGIGVIMDVVYNHTALNDDSNFSLTAPGYFYRHCSDGSYSNASGCGNETASERKMMSDFIVNSVKYWASEYHIDGFRFDLMAIHDIETMNRVVAELKAINPNIIVYGEGWTAGDSPLRPERRALKENVSKMNGIAVFSDDIRDAVKGHYSDAADRGFATGKPGLEETVKIGIVASTDHPQVDYSKGNNSKVAYASSPTQIINYVSCHDDLTLTDKLRRSMPDDTDDERKRAARLAQTIVLTSQGTPFIFAGEEIFRDKKGVHNSYKSPDSINAIDWNLKSLNSQQFNYYRELIALRKAHPAFRMTTADEIAHHINFDISEPNLLGYTITDHANGDEWKEIKIVFNGRDTDAKINIPEGNWTIVAFDGNLDHTGIKNADGTPMKTMGGAIIVPHRSALIAMQRK